MNTTLLDKDQIAKLVNCHPRHVYRMVSEGKLPQPVKIGKLCRWSSSVIDQWIADGCPEQKGAAK